MSSDFYSRVTARQHHTPWASIMRAAALDGRTWDEMPPERPVGMVSEQVTLM